VLYEKGEKTVVSQVTFLFFVIYKNIQVTRNIPNFKDAEASLPPSNSPPPVSILNQMIPVHHEHEL
jgi:hypothetical protein